MAIEVDPLETVEILREEIDLWNSYQARNIREEVALGWPVDPDVLIRPLT